MYLMCIRHESFCSRAGAAWRQIFVQAVMPWTRKYRVFAETRLLQAVESYHLTLEELEDAEKDIAARFGEDLGAMGTATIDGVRSGTETAVALATETVAGTVNTILETGGQLAFGESRNEEEN